MQQFLFRFEYLPLTNENIFVDIHLPPFVAQSPIFRLYLDHHKRKKPSKLIKKHLAKKAKKRQRKERKIGNAQHEASLASIKRESRTSLRVLKNKIVSKSHGSLEATAMRALASIKNSNLTNSAQNLTTVRMQSADNPTNSNNSNPNAPEASVSKSGSRSKKSKKKQKHKQQNQEKSGNDANGLQQHSPTPDTPDIENEEQEFPTLSPLLAPDAAATLSQAKEINLNDSTANNNNNNNNNTETVPKETSLKTELTSVLEGVAGNEEAARRGSSNADVENDKYNKRVSIARELILTPKNTRNSQIGARAIMGSNSITSQENKSFPRKVEKLTSISVTEVTTFENYDIGSNLDAGGVTPIIEMNNVIHNKTSPQSEFAAAISKQQQEQEQIWTVVNAENVIEQTPDTSVATQTQQNESKLKENENDSSDDESDSSSSSTTTTTHTGTITNTPKGDQKGASASVATPRSKVRRFGRKGRNVNKKNESGAVGAAAAVSPSTSNGSNGQFRDGFPMTNDDEDEKDTDVRDRVAKQRSRTRSAFGGKHKHYKNRFRKHENEKNDVLSGLCVSVCVCVFLDVFD